MVAIHTKYMTRNDCYIANKQITVTKLMLHSTATKGVMAKEWFSRWNKSYIKGETNRQVCVHGFVDDKEVWQYLPWNHRAWHAGASANNFAIGIEMCEDLLHTKEFADKTIKNAAELFAFLCKEFNLDPMKDIISHKEGYKLGVASNHGDPDHWIGKFGYTMDSFRKMVYDIMNPVSDVENKKVMYRVILDGKQLMALSTYESAKAEINKVTKDGSVGIVQRTDGFNMYTLDKNKVQLSKPKATWELHISGKAVRNLQTAVNKFYGDKRLAVDGFYGDATFNGVPNNIRLGMKGYQIIKEIQTRLKALGFYKDKIDGSFGYGTEKAVKELQKDRGFSKSEQDGIVGKFTFSELYKKIIILELI